jgi:hypothetical protein
MTPKTAAVAAACFTLRQCYDSGPGTPENVMEPFDGVSEPVLTTGHTTVASSSIVQDDALMRAYRSL